MNPPRITYNGEEITVDQLKAAHRVAAHLKNPSAAVMLQVILSHGEKPLPPFTSHRFFLLYRDVKQGKVAPPSPQELVELIDAVHKAPTKREKG